jgi:hypothetical protein
MHHMPLESIAWPTCAIGHTKTFTHVISCKDWSLDTFHVCVIDTCVAHDGGNVNLVQDGVGQRHFYLWFCHLHHTMYCWFVFMVHRPTKKVWTNDGWVSKMPFNII